MSGYAAQTSVSPEKSRIEIEHILRRYGATEFAYGWDQGQAAIGFVIRDRRIRLTLPMPDPKDREFTRTPTGRPRSATATAEQYDQATRQRWRAMALIVKAKLEAVSSGIVTFEDEFAAYVVLPDGSTVGEWLHPQIDKAYSNGAMPSLLPARRAIES